jgi:hypothetical protein
MHRTKQTRPANTSGLADPPFRAMALGMKNSAVSEDIHGVASALCDFQTIAEVHIKITKLNRNQISLLSWKGRSSNGKRIRCIHGGAQATMASDLENPILLSTGNKAAGS